MPDSLRRAGVARREKTWARRGCGEGEELEAERASLHSGNRQPGHFGRLRHPHSIRDKIGWMPTLLQP